MTSTAPQILLVDDDPVSLAMLAGYLTDANYRICTAENGIHAWQLLQQQPQRFSLVISDRIMPGLHGLDLWRQMQHHQGLKDIPFIMLTGHTEKEEMIEALKAGIFDFLIKPVEKELLLPTVKKALRLVACI